MVYYDPLHYFYHFCKAVNYATKNREEKEE